MDVFLGLANAAIEKRRTVAPEMRRPMKPRTMTKSCLYLIIGLVFLLLGVHSHAHGQSVVKSPGGDASLCVSIVTSQHFGQAPQYYFRSTCQQKVHMAFCFQVADTHDTNPFNCNVRLGGFDIVAGEDISTSPPVAAYIVNYFGCYDPQYPKNTKFNGHGIDGKCAKL